MPYTPENNPYIPGDPYSYDLKWIVAKIKEYGSALANLDSLINEAVLDALAKKNVAFFKTVDDLIPADVKADAVVFCSGYHDEEDGGGNYFVISDDYVIQPTLPFYVVLDNGLFAVPLLTKNELNPEMFGAYGNGSDDDTLAIQYMADVCAADSRFMFGAPSNHTYKVSGDLNLRGLQYIDFKGTIDNSGKIEISPVSNAGYPNRYHFNGVNELHIKGGANATFDIDYCLILKLIADGNDATNHYIGYCTFNLGYVRDLYFEPANSGWINDNKFFGGHVINLYMYGDGTSRPNNNTFYGFKMEGNTIDIQNGYSNHFYDLRCESLQDIIFGSNSFNNIIEVSWNQYPHGATAFPTTPPATPPAKITDNGIGNVVTSPYHHDFVSRVLFDSDMEHLGTAAEYDDSGMITYTQNVQLVESNKFNFTGQRGFYIKSSEPIFRFYVSFFDETGTAVDPSIDLSPYIYAPALTYSQAAQRYTNATGGGTDANPLSISIAPNPYIKRIQIAVRTVNYTPDSWKVDQFKIVSLEPSRALYDSPVWTDGKTERAAAPSSGYWAEGTFVRNSAGNSPAGWICMASGTPGTWVPINN